MVFCVIKMKAKIITVPKSNRKIVERGKIDASGKQRHDRSSPS
jgi:hypothetical protein